MENDQKCQVLEKKHAQQRERLGHLQRKMDENDKRLKGLTSSSGADLNNDIQAMREELSEMKDRQKTSLPEVLTLRRNRTTFTTTLDRLQRIQAQTDTDITSMKMDQEKIKQEISGIKEWQKEAVNIASQKEEKQKNIKESIFKKDAETKKLVKELHQMIKAEFQERSKYRAEFTFTQTLLLEYQLPIGIDEYKNVKLICKYFDSKTGKYAAPVRGIYKFTTKIKLGSKGRIQFNLRCRSGNTLSLVTGGEFSGKFQEYEKEFFVRCAKGEEVWVEVKNMEAASDIWDCQFCGELMPEMDEEENDDDDDDNDGTDKAEGLDEAGIEARLVVLNLLFNML